MRRIGERQIVGNFLNWLAGKDKLPFRLGQHALADQMPRRDPYSLYVIVETIRRHRQLLGIEADQTLLAEMLIDQPMQSFDRGIRCRKRHRPGAGAARGKPRHFDRNQRQQTAHRETETFPGEEAFLIEVRA